MDIIDRSNQRPCTDCKGRGIWNEEKTDGELVTKVVNHCGTCRGTGRLRPPLEEEDDFDIEGSSFDADQD